MKEVIERVKKYSIKNNNKRILKNYYSKEMKSGKTYRASIIDRLLFFILVFVSLSIVLSIKSSDIILSCYMAGIISFFSINILKKLSDKKRRNGIEEINEDLKKRKTIRDLNGKNNTEFIEYIKTIFAEYYDTDIIDGEVPVDLECIIEDERYGIKCIKGSTEEKVSLRQVENFIKELKELKYNNGILVTNSYFMEDISEQENIILFDLDNIIDILKKLDKYVSNKEIEEYIIHRFINRRNDIKKQFTTINKRKIVQLYSIFIVFYLLSYMVRYSLYYKVIAIISFLIATGIVGYKFSEYIRLKDKYP